MSNIKLNFGSEVPKPHKVGILWIGHYRKYAIESGDDIPNGVFVHTYKDVKFKALSEKKLFEKIENYINEDEL